MPCSTVAELNCSSSTAMTMPWSPASVAPKTDETSSASLLQDLGIKDRHYGSRRLRWHGYVQRVVPCIKSVAELPISGTRGPGRPKRHGLNVWRLMLIFVSWLPSIRKTKMYGVPVFDIAWYCQPNRMRHGQHPNLKWIWINGWTEMNGDS